MPLIHLFFAGRIYLRRTICSHNKHTKALLSIGIEVVFHQLILPFGIMIVTILFRRELGKEIALLQSIVYVLVVVHADVGVLWICFADNYLQLEILAIRTRSSKDMFVQRRVNFDILAQRPALGVVCVLRICSDDKALLEFGGAARLREEVKASVFVSPIDME